MSAPVIARVSASAAMCIAAVVAVPVGAGAASGSCSESIGLWGASATCTWSYPEYQQTSSSGEEHTWYVSVQSANGGIRRDDLMCTENGQTGLWHDVFMDGVDVGDVCVPDAEVDEVNIGEMVIRRFKDIAWPDSNLVVQPPKGKTLVNFETNFYTLDSIPIDQTVTVANRQVVIRAVPTTYAFHFGDGAVTRTASPGRPHPDLDVTHVYERVGTVEVRLDTTYSGEYRIGDGDWVDIPDTLTVTGEPQDLEVVEALPQLVLE